MARVKRTHFVTQEDVRVERFPWGPHDWLSRPDLVDSEQLLVVRIEMKKGQGCPFHLHPNMEEMVYVLQGVAEQWVGEEVRLLRTGEIAHIPRDTVHATFNAGRGVLRVLSTLVRPPAASGSVLNGGLSSDAGTQSAEVAPLIDVSSEEPWCSIRSLETDDVDSKQRALRSALKRAQRDAEVAETLQPALKTKRGAAKTAKTGKPARSTRRPKSPKRKR